MGVLVEDLLLLAQVDRTRPLEIEAGRPRARSSTDAAADARTVAPERPIELKVPGPLVVQGDEDRLRQAVAQPRVQRDLAHTDASAPIELEVSQENGTAVITVADTGEASMRRPSTHAFERFWRADPNRARSERGRRSRLGDRRRHRQGARWDRSSAENRPEGGACFSIHLPLERMPASRASSGFRGFSSKCTFTGSPV